MGFLTHAFRQVDVAAYPDILGVPECACERFLRYGAECCGCLAPRRIVESGFVPSFSRFGCGVAGCPCLSPGGGCDQGEVGLFLAHETVVGAVDFYHANERELRSGPVTGSIVI